MRDLSHPGPRMAPRKTIAAIATVAAVLTVLVSVLPFIEFAYRSERTHVSLETAASVIALLAAVIVMGRFARSRALSDLLLAGALLLLAASNVVFAVVPSLAGGGTSRFDVWAPLLSRAISAAILAGAAFAPDRTLPRPRALLLWAVGAVTAALALVALAIGALGTALPAGVDPLLSPESSARPRVVGPTSILTLQVLIMLAYLLAAAGFVRRAERRHDELMLWFAGAAMLAAFSRLNYFLFPSVQTEWIYTGDLFRLAFYLLLFGGAIREIAAYQGKLAATAVLEERRRMARDLHDGLAQELAFISSQVHRLENGTRPEVLEMISRAADRALEDSRGAIASITRPADEPLEVSLRRATEEVARRGGARVRLQVEPDLEVPATVHEALVRVVREATSNAIRHGEAGTVSVFLDTKGGLSLRISDDGKGFGREAPRAEGFGLISMRERIEGLGGSFAINSAPGEGTAIEVSLS